MFDPAYHLQGLGGIAPETARRLACDADLLGAVVNGDGEVLALGGSRRLVSRAHTAVREGGVRIIRAALPTPGRRWDAVMPDGIPHRD